MAGGHQALDGILGARAGVHVAVGAFQARVGVGAVGERVAAFFVAVGAQLGDAGGFGRLRVGIVAGRALDALLSVHAGTPFSGGGLVARPAQLGIGGDGHGLLGMVGLEGAVAGFAGHAFFRIATRERVIASGVTLQAGGLLAQVTPIALEDRRGESLGVPGGQPLGVQILVTFFARL